MEQMIKWTVCGVQFVTWSKGLSKLASFSLLVNYIKLFVTVKI